jgi:hypothetical protein
VDAYNAADRKLDDATWLLNAAREQAADMGGRVPDAPFKDSWPELGLKQQLLEAVDDPDTSWIGFTAGQTQAARYDLSKQIKTLRVERIGGPGEPLYVVNAQQHGGGPQVDLGAHEASKLPEVIGKEMAERIVNNAEKTQMYEGLNLQVGGEGMKKFYDELLPKRLEKIVKPFGGTVERAPVMRQAGKPTDFVDFDAWQRAVKADPAQSQTPAWIVRLTPEMKAKIKAAGLPLMAIPLAVSHDREPQE